MDHDKPKRAEIRARFKFNGRLVEAVVVNPGEWMGKTWLVFVADCFDPPFYIVESDCESDAIDTFVESDYGKAERIDVEVEGGDYGFQVSPGDLIGKVSVAEKGWMNLKGEFFTDAEVKEKKLHFAEVSTTGNGIDYDDDNMQVHRVVLPLYFGPGLPECGVDPENYANKAECRNCPNEFFPNTAGATSEYCSAKCEKEDKDDE